MLDIGKFNRIVDASLSSRSKQVRTGDEASAELSPGAEEFFLDDVTGSLTGCSGSNPRDRVGEALADPPVWVEASEVEGRLVATKALSLTHTVCRKRKPFTVNRPRLEELQVLRVELPPERPRVWVVLLQLPRSSSLPLQLQQVRVG